MRRLLRSRRWRSVAVCAGKDYLTALPYLARHLPADVSPTLLGGGLGKRLTALRDWLRQEPGRKESSC